MKVLQNPQVCGSPKCEFVCWVSAKRVSMPPEKFWFSYFWNHWKHTNLLKQGTFTPSMGGILRYISTFDGLNSRVTVPSRRVLMQEKYSCECERVRLHRNVWDSCSIHETWELWYCMWTWKARNFILKAVWGLKWCILCCSWMFSINPISHSVSKEDERKVRSASCIPSWSHWTA